MRPHLISTLGEQIVIESPDLYNGTHVVEYERHFGPLGPCRSNVGRFLNDQVIQRWRHRIAFSWEINDHLNLPAGVLNLFDEEPPLSNQAFFFIAGYDPTYTDPRGRSYYLGVDYMLF